MSGTLLEQILAANDLPDPIDIVVPEWNGVTVWVHGLTVGEVERCEHLAARSQEEGTGLVLATFVAYGVRDEKGVRIFEDHAIPLVATKGIAPVKRLAEMVKARAKIGKTDAEARKIADDTMGNSPATPDGASSSS